VKDHLELLCSQYLASAMRPSHPSHEVVTAPPGSCRMKETLHSECFKQVKPHLTDGLMLEINYKKAISSLHTAAVAKAVCEAGPNPVLGLYPPNVNPEEETLTRGALCQLRFLQVTVRDPSSEKSLKKSSLLSTFCFGWQLPKHQI
jgi:hypothetical protein